MSPQQLQASPQCRDQTLPRVPTAGKWVTGADWAEDKRGSATTAGYTEPTQKTPSPPPRAPATDDPGECI